MSSILLPGVDMVCLSTRDFEVLDGSVMGFNKETKQGQKEENLPTILIDRNGIEYRGQQLKYRGEGLNFFVGINDKGLKLQFNPSKNLHAYNLLTDVKVIQNMSEAISHELNDVGIKFNYLDCKLTRLDLAKQDFMERDLNDYLSVFSYLDGKRMKGQQYETGYTFSNTLHESCFYSKAEETGLPELKGMLRGENRWKKRELISKSLGYSIFADFLKSDSIQLNEHYNRYLNEKIFRQSKQGSLFDFDNEVSKLKYFKEKGRNALNNYLISTTLDSYIHLFGKIDHLWKVMSEAGFTRQQIHNEKKRIRELIKLTGKNKIVSIGTLINELQQKFAA